jgi:hypothetical protein
LYLSCSITFLFPHPISQYIQVLDLGQASCISSNSFKDWETACFPIATDERVYCGDKCRETPYFTFGQSATKHRLLE